MVVFYADSGSIRPFVVIFVSSRGGSTTFYGKKIVLGYFHDLATIEYFRLNIEYLRSASGASIIYYKTERHAAQAPALRERHPQIFNLQSSIFNSGMSG
jgi:hypothetical protein